ncbi:hypothetical protein [Hypericibacter sp.]|uniref:hypothetical protein n=1 Tax=Hypericibacter sp. TaxID=2705401 RepID=UPI003D6CAA1F
MAEATGVVVETALIGVGHDAYAPMAGAASRAVVSYLETRFRVARDIIEDEFRVAGVTDGHFHDDQQLAAGAYRYARAVRDQSADENLRLLAQAMVGLARRDKAWVSDFLKFADILAPLSRDEIVFVGILVAADSKNNDMPEPKPGAADLAKSALAEAFGDDDLTQAIAGRSLRSGLVIAKTGWGSLIYVISPLGREVRDLINVDRALNPEN